MGGSERPAGFCLSVGARLAKIFCATGANLASTLVRAGQPLKVVGDLLGHRVPEATLLYCKIAVEDLRSVALDLPEASS